MRRILWDVRANMLIWIRSPTAVFFTFAFPVLIMAIFGAIFGDSEPPEVGVQDLDGSAQSAALVQAVGSSGAVKVHTVPTGMDAAAYARGEDLPATLVIPRGYAANLSRGQPTDLPLWVEPGSVEARQAAGIVQGVVQDMNVRLTGTAPRLRVQSAELPVTDERVEGGYVAYLVPGLIGMTIASSSLMGSLEVSATLRESGIMRRLIATPLSRWEWVVAKALHQVVLGLMTLGTILLTARLLFGVSLAVSAGTVLVLVLAAGGFAGLAMVISRWVKRPDQANAAGSAVFFPMMFLSGTFFPLASMPPLLRQIANFLPLTYVNEGLRAAVITHDASAFVWNAGILALFAVVTIGVASLVMEWKEV